MRRSAEESSENIRAQLSMSSTRRLYRSKNRGSWKVEGRRLGWHGSAVAAMLKRGELEICVDAPSFELARAR